MNTLFFRRKTFSSTITSIFTIAALLVQLTAPVIAYAIEESPVEAQTETLEQSTEITQTTEEFPIEETNNEIQTPTTITVTATKIVCDNEADLPDWGIGLNGAPSEITSDTATTFLAAHENCRAVSGWDFQWGDQDDEYPSNGDTHIGLIEGYQSFGAPTDENGVTEVVIPINGISKVFVGEVQKEGYIPFTAQASGNTDTVTAEFYCGDDIYNYDNFEGIGNEPYMAPIVPGKNYHCVAWNVLEDKQEESRQCDVVSDTSSTIEGTSDNAVETWVHPAWAKPLWMTGSPFAKWIWSSLYVENPTTQEEKTFVKTFTLDTVPSTATIELAADNGFILEINGTIIDDKITIETNYGSTVSYPVTNLVAGTNTIKMTVRNFAGSANPQENPAGALYRLHIEDSACIDSQEEGRGKIHTIKFVDGVRATKASVDDAMFPMLINPSDGDFMLKSSGWVPGEDGEYEATTFAHPNGSVFTIDENLTTDLVGASCEEGRPYALTGYSTASTYQEAITAEKTTVAPAITIDGDQYLIVHNTKCTDNPQDQGKGKIHVIKFIGGVRATAQSADNASFPMNINNPNGDFVLKPSGWVEGDGVYEATTHVHKKGKTFTIDENLTTPLVGASCAEGRPYALAGYSTASTYVDAITAEKTTVAPAITIDGDQYLIVHNIKCEVQAHVYKYLRDGEGMDAQIPNESTVTPFPMVSTWTEPGEEPGVGYYTLGIYNGGAPLKYASLTANMKAGSDYSTSEQTNTGFVLAPGAQCVPNMYRLVGYKKGIGSLAAAQAAPLTEDASFTNLGDDAYIIVVNEDCDDLPPAVDICPNLEGDQSVLPEGYYLDGEECLPNVFTDGEGEDENTGGGNGGSGSRSRSSGSVLGASATAGDAEGLVLGASMCSEYIHSYIKLGKANDKADVIRLQAFLNTYMGSLLMTTGVYDQQTFDVLKAFQVKEAGQVLEPWKQTPGGIDGSGTGYVYKTTKRWINMIKCPELNLAIPPLTH